MPERGGDRPHNILAMCSGLAALTWNVAVVASCWPITFELDLLQIGVQE